MSNDQPSPALEKRFDSPAIEKKWREKWRSSKIFTADAKSQKPPYVIIMPPLGEFGRHPR